MSVTIQIESVLKQILSKSQSGFQQSVPLEISKTNNQQIKIITDCPKSLTNKIIEYFEKIRIPSVCQTNDLISAVSNFLSHINILYEDDTIQDNIIEILKTNNHINEPTKISIHELHDKLSYLNEEQLKENLKKLEENNKITKVIPNGRNIALPMNQQTWYFLIG